MNRIVRVEPTETYFSITWMIGSRCNYDCMYCPPELHDSDSELLSLDQLKQYWSDIYTKTQHQKLKYKISFTGGEVTVNKNFYPFIEWLSIEYGMHIHQLLCTTNGSAGVNYYKKLYKYIDSISFSFHSEHADEQDFFKKVTTLKKSIGPKKFLHVNVMDELWNRTRIPLYTDILSQHKISHSVNEINYTRQTRVFPIMKGKTNLGI